MSVPSADVKTISLAETNNSSVTTAFVSNDNMLNRSSNATIQDVASSISQPDVTPQTHVHQTTGFIDDATTMKVSLPELITPEKPVISDSIEGRLHTIIDVLSRPVVVSHLTWDPSDTVSTQLVELDFPQALFDATPNIADKLNYFAFLRADVAIRIMVNANTFQQGKLLGYFTPFTKQIGDRAAASDFLTSKTAFPYTICDAAIGNTAEIVIPYVAPYSSYRLFDQVGNIGTFFLVVLNALTQTDAKVTIQAWFTNISVDLPSGMLNSLTPSGSVVNDLKRVLENKDDNNKIVKKLSKLMLKYKAQVAGETEQKSSSGIVSSTLHTISKIGEVASDIPVLAPVAAPVSWVSKALAQVAEYYGFCKTSDMSHTCKLAQMPANGFTNAGGVDNSLILGSSPENAIENRGDLFGSKIDDMSITYVVSHRCYVTQFEFTDTGQIGDKLITFPVTPGWCDYNVVEACFEPTTTAYVASMFNFWRGGLRYKIQAAKTAYHSGRIRIVYIPNNIAEAPDDIDQTYSWVFDLRNQSEIEFTIPYNNILEWQPCDLTNNINSRSSIGTVRIEVFNTLKRPESVSASVFFNVWIAGDTDLQFAVPTMQRYVPSKPSVTTLDLKSGNFSRVAMRKKRSIAYKAQVLGTAQDMGFNDMSHKPEMFQIGHSDKIAPCKFSIGEHISNLRYLTRRFDNVASFALTQESAFTLPNYYFGDLYDPDEDDLSTFQFSPIDYISYLYRFFRGGIRWKAFYNGPVVTGGYQEMSLAHGVPSTREPANLTLTLYDRIALGTNTFRHRVFNTLNTVCEVMAPFFSQTPIRPIVGVDVAQPQLLEDSSTYYKFKGFTSQSGATVDFLKAAADDFSFGWIVGPPRLRPREGQLIQLDLTAATSAVYFQNSTEGNWIYAIRNITSNAVITDGGYEILISDTENIPALFINPSASTQSPTINFTLIVSNDGTIYDLNNQDVNAAPGDFDEPNTLSQLALIGPASNGLITVDLLRIT